MQSLVSAQQNYFGSNASKPVAARLAALKTLRSLVQDNEALLEDAIQADYGKGRFETFLTELFLVYDEIDTAIENLETWASRKPVADTPLTAPARCFIVPEPLGVALVIGPWNYPYQLSLAPVVAALAAGCTVILKPSELTEHCSALLATLISQAFAPELFAVVLGGVPETTALLEEKFDIIFFTGSVPVGRIVYQAAAKHLTPVVLELGGKSPTIIAADADLEITARRLTWAKFLNAGQTCISPDYVYVHESVHDAFLDHMKKAIASVDYSLEAGNYVQIINTRNAERVAALIDPKRVVIGGSYDAAKRIIEPTVMKDVTWSDKVMAEEIFGPLLPVMVYDDLDVVISEIKAREKPLSLYLFTEDEAIKAKVLGEVSFGGGCINDAIMHITNGHLPFGGVGASGIGNYHGEAGFRAFSHYKSVVDRAVVFDPDLKFSPYSDEKLETLRCVVGIQ